MLQNVKSWPVTSTHTQNRLVNKIDITNTIQYLLQRLVCFIRTRRISLWRVLVGFTFFWQSSSSRYFRLYRRPFGCAWPRRKGRVVHFIPLVAGARATDRVNHTRDGQSGLSIYSVRGFRWSARSGRYNKLVHPPTTTTNQATADNNNDR